VKILERIIGKILSIIRSSLCVRAMFHWALNSMYHLKDHYPTQAYKKFHSTTQNSRATNRRKLDCLTLFLLCYAKLKTKPPSCCYVWWRQTAYQSTRHHVNSILIFIGRVEVMANFSQVCKQYACFTLLLFILSSVGFFGCLSWLYMMHHSKRLGVLNRMIVFSALQHLDWRSYGWISMGMH